MPVLFDNPSHALIHVEVTADWLKVSEICKEYLTGKDYIQFQEYLKDDVKTILIEKKYIDKDYRDTFSNFYSKKFVSYPSTTYRIHFFRSLFTEQDLFDLELHAKDYIGFTVIRPTQVNSIGRTIFDPSKISNLQGLYCCTGYKIHLFGTELEINGFPYISQDTDVTICAHAATWMTFRYYSERYTTYREIFPYEISQLSSDVSRGRLIPSKGLTALQITEIFSNYGFYPEIYLQDQYKDIFYRLLYYYIESGIPVVACLHKKQHAVTLLGHISDFSRSAPNKNSEDYLTGYVVNDDNHLPYQLMMKETLPKNGYCSRFHVEDIDGFIVPLYEKMYLSAEHIEGLVDSLLADQPFGVNYCSKLVTKDILIKRIFLTSSKSYKVARRKDTLPFDLHKNYIEVPMPKFIWVCELSLAGIYPNKQIVGEIIFDATGNHEDRFSFLAIHYPDFILFNDRNIPGNRPDRFVHFRLPTDQLLPYAMYKNNLKEI
jgi:hypothetical protein